jgi:hypothetical protein
MKHNNLKGVYIEKNGLERVTSIDVLLLMSVRINFTVLQPHFPHSGPTQPVRPSSPHLGSFGVHDFTKELVSPLY